MILHCTKKKATKMATSLSQKFEDAFKQGGIPSLCSALDTHINAWNAVEINIAVAGQAGSGKSSFINSLRDINADDEGAAEVGSVETTLECTPYTHPMNDKFVVWDLPGSGTPNFSKETFLEKVNIDHYDFFIIISCNTKPTENDKWLATEIEKRGRRFYFVRSHFANEIQNEKLKNRKKKHYTKDEDNTFTEVLYNKVYTVCHEQLQYFESRDNIFIIDNYEKDRFDFEKLKTKMIGDTVKKETIIFTLKAVTKDAIMEKKQMLKKRMLKKALRAALAPGFGNADVKILLEEQRFYREQLDINTDTIERDCKTSQIEERMNEFMQEAARADNDLLKSTLLKEITTLVPFFPPIANQIWAFGSSKQWLTEALESAVEQALKLQQEMVAGMVEARTDQS